MIKNLATLMSLGAAGLAVATTTASADTYTAQVNTRCEVSIPEVVKLDSTFAARVRVRANSTADPAGSLIVTLRRSGAPVWTRTVAFTGDPVRVVGPALNRVGDYEATAMFRPSDRSSFRGCTGSIDFWVARDTSPVDEDPGTDDTPDAQGGLLPDTGGPDVWWLVAGVALVGTGSGLVVAARRRGSRLLVDG